MTGHIPKGYVGCLSAAGGTMKCPHCLESFHEAWSSDFLDDRYEGARWRIDHQECPSCKKAIISLAKITSRQTPVGPINDERDFPIYPRTIARSPLSVDIPETFTSDYKEACLVLADSPKASAALSRRCLQYLLHEKVGIRKRNLDQEIEEVIKHLPHYLASDVDAIRTIGNFAAHPIKSTSTGEIVEVEEGEADWLLNVLEELFEFYFVAPAAAQRKRDALNQKLQDAGKPKLKTGAQPAQES